MKTHDQIKQIADKLGFKCSSANAACYEQVHKYIGDNENIIHMLNGNMSIGVITDMKLLAMTASLLSPPDAKEVQFKNISNMEIDAGFMYSDLNIMSMGSTIKISHNKKDELIDFKNKISEAINKASQAPVANAGSDVISQLERLAKLKEQGILSEDEFKEQKQKILAGS